MNTNRLNIRKLMATMCVAAAAAGFALTAHAVDYDPNVDYMKLMIIAAANGDTAALSEAAECRNAKIEGMNLSYAPVTSMELLQNFEACAGFSLQKDYMAEIVECCKTGDYDRGVDAAQKRNRKITILGLEYTKFTYDEFCTLAKIIHNEAGSSWLPMEWKMAVGEVVLNRVASSKFPNNIYDVVHQRGQYAGANSSRFASMTPSDGCIQAAVNLMNGERVFNDTRVLYQANFRQGNGVARAMYDSTLGTTYFCYG